MENIFVCLTEVSQIFSNQPTCPVKQELSTHTLEFLLTHLLFLNEDLKFIIQTHTQKKGDLIFMPLQRLLNNKCQ